uniref:Ig-like domain-containing protein n=1 Tax=Astatotilapia calliptera TaxID=8154 RepID=A0AAX7V1A2_ASTCA
MWRALLAGSLTGKVLAAVKLQHSWSQIFTGETITLRCEIQGGEGKVWKYEWTAPNTNSPPTSSEYRISRVSVSHSGDYRCRGRYSCRGRRDYFFSEWSDIITLTVSSVPVGGSVTLTCSVSPSSSSGWKYYWYRDEKSSEALTTQDAVFHSNGQISVSQEGLYRCRGGRGNPVYYTEDSQSVRIGKTGQFNMKSDKFLIKEEDEEKKNFNIFDIHVFLLYFLEQ